MKKADDKKSKKSSSSSTSDDTSDHKSDDDIDEDDDVLNRGYVSPFGIKNIGNTCFMNSTLQCLLSLSIFIKKIPNLISKSDSPKLLKEFRVFMKSHASNKIKQLVAKMNKAFIGFAQQDSFEFLIAFINSIAEENPKGTNELFIGKSKTISLCTKCHKETNISEEFSSIILSIQEARKILYIPYSFKKHPIFMSDIPVTSKKIKIRESRTSKITIGKFILVTKISNEYKVIDKIKPEYTDIYAFEIPNTTIDKGSGYIVVQFKNEEGEPITFPFICQIPIKQISKDRIKNLILERLQEVINSDLENNEIKRTMNITKPTFPPEFILNDTKSNKTPICKTYINIKLTNESIFEFDNRTAQNEDKEIDLTTLFEGHIQQKQLQAGCKWKCDKCGKETRVFRRIKYTKLPKILIFQIKRSNEAYMTFALPDNTKISLPQTITINQSKYDEMTTKSKDKTGTKYELRSISHHSGSFQGGHYWCNGKRGDKWFDFNDLQYEPLDESEEDEATGSSHLAFYQQILDGEISPEPEKCEEDEEDEEDEEKTSPFVGIKIDEEEDEDPGFVGPFGIKNVGKSSYMNSALQCFLSLSLFVEKMDDLIDKPNGKVYPEILNNFRGFMIHHIPTKIKDIINKKSKAYHGFSQRDSFEFTVTLVNSIAKENPKGVNELFFGKLKAISLCTKCHQETNVTESFSSIILPIQEARKVLYVPYSFKKHPIFMYDIPVTSKKIKIRESRTSKITIGKFILVTKISNEYKVIDKIKPEYTDIYAFEIPNTTIDKGSGYIVVQFKNEEGEPITFPFICQIPIKQISKDRIKNLILERLQEVINSDLENNEIKRTMNITKPTFPPEFILNDTKPNKTPICKTYINIKLTNESIFEFDNRTAQNEDKEIDLTTLFEGHIQQKQPQAAGKWKCDKCGEETCAYHRIKYTKLPKILIFQIKRSIESYMTTIALPDNTKVSIPQTITISQSSKNSKYDEMTTKSKDKTGTKYELRSISHHSGSFQAGRDWSECKRGDKWFNIDDNKFSEIEEIDDAKGSEYVVFYQQVKDTSDDDDDE